MTSVLLRSIASTHHDAGEPDVLGRRRLDADMAHVLNTLNALGVRRLDTLSPGAARTQPSLANALRMILRGRYDDMGVAMEMRLIHGPAGDLRARVYRPMVSEAGAALPMILYLHGGGFVVGDLEAYDPTPRLLAARCRAIVVATHYRQAPEFKFPAAFEDVQSAWTWMVNHAEPLGGDVQRTAIVGEDAGATMAIDVAIAARQAGGARPRHLALVAPLTAAMPEEDAGVETSPLVGPRTIAWFYKKALRRGAGDPEPRLDPLGRADLGQLPPTTVVLAALDPLRDGGERLAGQLRTSGVWIDVTVYEGVTHGFFGLAQVVNKAMFAQSQVARNLSAAFA